MIIVVHSDKIFLPVFYLNQLISLDEISVNPVFVETAKDQGISACTLYLVPIWWLRNVKDSGLKDESESQASQSSVRRGEGDLSLTVPGCRPKEEQTVCHQLSPRICQDCSPTHNALLLTARRPRDGHTAEMLLTQIFWD